MVSIVQRAWATLGLTCALPLVALAQTPVAITPPNLAGAVAGTLAGLPGVSPGGAATYTIPLAVPPGTAGIAPSLSLQYSSQGADGYLGQGWTIGGLSSIQRCASSIVQDGVRGRVTFSPSDQFCLDGQRLLLVSGTQGATAEYRTQVETFSQVLSSGSSPSKGPDSWTVRTKGGLIYTYGATVDATVVAQANNAVVHTWLLQKVSDRSKNYYTVGYTQNPSTGEFYVSTIRYTGNENNAQLPYNAVNFLYEARPDTWTGYLAGSQLQRTLRLSGVQTRVNTAADGSGGTLVRDYRISYGLDPLSGRSQVHTITDCDGAGNCLPSTTFAWTAWNTAGSTFNAPGSGNWGGPPVVFNANLTLYGQYNQQVATQVLALDIDGDGVTDLVRGDGAGNWQVCLSTKSSFNCRTWPGPTAASATVLMGDFMGLGRSQIAVPPSAAGPGNWTVCSFDSTTGLSCSAWAGQSTGRGVSSYLVADVDGDGRDDIIMAATGGDMVCRSLGDHFATDGAGNPCSAYSGASDFMAKDIEAGALARPFHISGDFFGDGRSGEASSSGGFGFPPILHATETALGEQLPASGTPNGAPVATATPGGTNVTDQNGDGYADLVTQFAANTGNGLQVCRSTGTSIVCPPINGAGSSYGGVWYVGDADGDGRPEVYVGGWQVCQLGESAPYQAGSSFASGANFVCQAWAPPANGNSPTGWLIGDFNGDGHMDWAYYYQSTNTWSIFLHGDGGIAGQLDTVTDGAGHQVQFSYSKLNNPAVYGKGADVAYPRRTLTQGPAVVSQMRIANGQGGWLATDYQYQSLRRHLTGYGSLGFAVVAATDEVSGVTTTTTFSQDFPTVGMPLATTVRHTSQPAGCALSSVTNTLAALSTTAGAKYPYQASSTAVKQDLNCASVSTVMDRVDAIDSYGNVTSAYQSVTADGDSFSTTTTNAFNATIPVWPYNLLSSVTVTKSSALSANGQPTVALSLSQCASSGTTTSPTPATMTCNLSNLGQAAASTIAYAGPAGTAASGPTSCAAGTASCGAVTVSVSAPGTFSGTLTATPSTGSAASTPVSLSVNPSPPSLAFSNCSSTSPTVAPTAAVLTCTLANTGQTAVTSISYSAFAGVTVSGPAACGASASCGTVRVTTGTAGGTYAGTLTATPNAGSAASTAVSLVVQASVATLTSPASQSVAAAWYGSAVRTATVTYRNDGTASMTLATPSLASPLSVTSNSCTGVAPAASCSMVISVASNVAGIAQSQTFTPAGANTAPAATTVSWTTYTAVPRWSASSLAFGNVTANTSASQTITLSNDGNTAYNWAANAAVTNAPSGFTFNTSACSNVAPGGSCSVTVTFTPTAVGASYSGSSLTMSAASYSTNTFAVSGTGSGSILTMVSATSLTFTTMTQGSPAPVVTWSFRNDGNANMGALALGTLNSPFSVTANYCTGPIPPGNSCSISAQMSTASQGSFSQSGISVSGATQGNRSDLQLAGTVTSSNTSVSGSPTSLAFGTVGKTQLRDLTVTFTNNGANAATGLTFTYATTSGSPSIGGYGPGPGSSCTSGGSLAAGASCTWVVEYEASCAAGGRNGTLTLSGSNFNPVPIALTATTSSSGVCR